MFQADGEGLCVRLDDIGLIIREVSQSVKKMMSPINQCDS